MNYDSLFNLVLPKSLQNETIEKKSINWGWLICAYLQLISTFIFFIVYSTVLFIDVYSSISLFIATIIQVVNVGIMLKSEQRPINLNLGNISLIFAIFIPAFQNGGISFPPLSWSITCIVYSAFLHKRNHFIFWIIIFSLLFILLYFLSPAASINSVNQFKLDSFIHRLFSTITVAFQVYTFAFVQKTITNEKIRIQKLQEKLLNENRNLLRIISHDVATPLTVLGISLKKISSNDINQKRSIERASTAVMAIKDTLEEVRNWQSIKDGKIKIILEEVLLDDVILSTLDLYYEKITEKNLKIEYNPNNIKVMVDPKIFKGQILSNLLSNAIKFSFRDSTIKILGQELENSIRISVIDSGMGIPEELLPNLFSTDIPTSRVGTNGETGTGFGMLILKESIEKMKGNLKIESRSIDKFKDLHGSSFHMYFPKIS